MMLNGNKAQSYRAQYKYILNIRIENGTEHMELMISFYLWDKTYSASSKLLQKVRRLF